MGPSNGSDCPRGGQVIACFDIPRGGQLAVVATHLSISKVSAGRTPLGALHRRSTHSAARTIYPLLQPNLPHSPPRGLQRGLVDSSSIPRRGQSAKANWASRDLSCPRRGHFEPFVTALFTVRGADRASSAQDPNDCIKVSAARTPTHTPVLESGVAKHTAHCPPRGHPPTNIWINLLTPPFEHVY